MPSNKQDDDDDDDDEEELHFVTKCVVDNAGLKYGLAWLPQHCPQFLHVLQGNAIAFDPVSKINVWRCGGEPIYRYTWCDPEWEWIGIVILDDGIFDDGRMLLLSFLEEEEEEEDGW